MNKQIKNFMILFWIITISRFLPMIFLPLTDTTEARYANTALIMSKLNDWITPYYDYGVSFWGKPPLAFWFEALSYKIFGIHDFTPRFPSMLITLMTIWLIYKLVVTLENKITAWLTITIYSGLMLVYALSGAVITDPYLTFGTTLSLVSFLMVINGYEKYWNYLFFVGVGLGILTKGPLALVVVGGIIMLWILLSYKKRLSTLAKFPWISGVALLLIIAIPWYIAAEIKTPGFLYYFIIGENLGRFLDTGWQGDKYGYVHKNPHGVIWLMWIVATLPWGLSALAITFKKITNKISRLALFQELKKDNVSFYVVWMLFLMLFFTFAGNVIWTYVLPSLPGFAIVLALYLSRKDGKYLVDYGKFIKINGYFVPIVSAIALFYILYNPSIVKTEKFLIIKYKSVSKGNEPIYFVRKKSFSSTYYMNRKLDLITLNDFNKIEKISKTKYFAVINKNDVSKIDRNYLKKIYKSKKYVLYVSK
ncbi:MAG: glycosyltransferase family 39 protein [Epsilonproteobacteria bacterium]|nr:glycosyltransferase family 39 protein [Campylobacterota bacterium]